MAYILLLIGIYGLIYEFSNPGTVLAGTVGAVSLVLALYAFQLLPVNYAGVALMLLGLALMIAEAFLPSFGALGIGGIAAFVVGSLILVDTDVPGFGLSIPLVLTFAFTSALLLVVIIGIAIRSRRRAVVSGSEQLIGAPVRCGPGGLPGRRERAPAGRGLDRPQHRPHRRRSKGQGHGPGGPDPDRLAPVR